MKARTGIFVICGALSISGATALLASGLLSEAGTPAREPSSEQPAESSEQEAIRRLIAGGDAAEAERRSRDLLARVEASEGRESLAAAETLSLLVKSMREGGRGGDPEAQRLAERALAIRERILGPDHLEVATSLHLLALTHGLAGDFAGAIPLFERALEIQEKQLGPDDLTAGRTLSDLAEAHREGGDYATSKRLHERVLALFEKAYGPESPKLAFYLNNMGSVLHQLGDYAGSRRLRERALAVTEKRYGADSPEAEPLLSNLALVFWETGAYEDARVLLERALAITEKNEGPESAYFAGSLGNLGALLVEIGDEAKAMPLLERAVGIMEKVLDPDDPALADALVNLAIVRGDQGDFAGAKALFERALPIAERSLGPDHPSVGVNLLAFAEARNQAEDYAAAEKLFERGIAIQERTRGTDHPFVGTALGGLAMARFQLGNKTTALADSLRAESIGRETLRVTSQTLSEREALAYASRRASGLNVALSVAVTSNDPTTWSRVWDAVVRSRALVLDEIAARHRVVAAGDPAIGATRDALVSASQQLAYLLVRGGQEDPIRYRESLEQARREKERAEQALAEKSLAFRRQVHERRVGLEDVTGHLAADDALVGYVLYRQIRIGARPVASYAAFILRGGGGTPSLIPFGPADEIDPLVFQWQKEAVGDVSWGGKASTDAEARYRTAGDALRRRIWDPIKSRLAGAKRVFVVPDGVLSLVSFASLPLGRAAYLVEKGPLLHYLSAERDLASPRARIPGDGSLLAIGNPDFDDVKGFARLAPLPQPPNEIPHDTKSAPTVVASYRGTRSACGDFQSVMFRPLPASAREAAEVTALWKEAGVPPYGEALIGKDASEAAFKVKAPGRRILHLSTHGFFLGRRCPSALEPAREIAGLVTVEAAPSPEARENPLLLSGLALAGANHREAAGPEEEDGILTAEEIAAMDLSGVEWAVLSACDTGVGEIKAGEGVFGLRRAFQVAGVRTLIMSLWSVSDQAAREWMRSLYESHLGKGLDAAGAVRQASLDVLHRRREKKESTHPFYWAAFVAAGD